MAFHRTDFPAFSWSESRERRRLACMRADYLATFGQHNGWERGASLAARATWTLGKLTTMAALVGAAVHRRATEVALRVQAGEALPSVRQLYAQCARELNTAIRASRAGRQAFLRAPASVTMLEEFFYRSGPSPQTLARLRERLDRALHHLVQAATVWDAVRDAGRDVVLMDRFASFVLRPEGITVYAAADLIFRRRRPRDAGVPPEPWVCVDWKTSRTDGVVDQLLTYALAMRDGLQLAPALTGDDASPVGEPGARDVRIYEGWIGALEDGELCRIDITASDVNGAATRIRAATRELYTYLQDPATNVPLPIEAFPQTKNPARCTQCVYRGRCYPAEYATPWTSLFASSEVRS